MAKAKKPRLELVDIAKAITIFLVILGHTTGNLETPMYRRVLYSFHMPLFFFLAGMSIRPVSLLTWDKWRSFLQKNILALVVPYLIWAFVYAPFDFKNVPLFLYGSWAALGKAGTLTSLWYLTAFFVARIITEAVISLLGCLKVKNMQKACFFSAIPAFALGFLLPYLKCGYPWCADVSLVAAGFILLGIAFRNPILIFAQQKGWVLGLAFAASTAIFAAGTVMRGDALDLSLMCGGIYGNIFWFMLNSITGSLVVFTVSMILTRIAREGAHPFSTAAISYIGQHTLGIFILHKNMLQALILPWICSFIAGPALLTAFLGSCVAFGASMLLCVIIEKYVPQLLGQFPRYE